MSKSIWIAAFLTWISWFLSNQSANARETRKEYAGFIEKFQHACSELEVTVLEHFQTKDFSYKNRLEVHRMLSAIERMLRYESLITGKETWQECFYKTSLEVSEIIDSGDEETRMDERLLTIHKDAFLLEVGNLISASHSTFVERYHVEEIKWWENKIHILTMKLIRVFMKLEAKCKALINKL